MNRKTMGNRLETGISGLYDGDGVWRIFMSCTQAGNDSVFLKQQIEK
jgi:hypothetical protein